MSPKGEPYLGVISMAEKFPKPARATLCDSTLVHCAQEIIEISWFIQKMCVGIYDFHLLVTPFLPRPAISNMLLRLLQPDSRLQTCILGLVSCTASALSLMTLKPLGLKGYLSPRKITVLPFSNQCKEKNNR
jgi:hypothetical protein